VNILEKLKCRLTRRKQKINVTAIRNISNNSFFDYTFHGPGYSLYNGFGAVDIDTFDTIHHVYDYMNNKVIEITTCTVTRKVLGVKTFLAPDGTYYYDSPRLRVCVDGYRVVYITRERHITQNIDVRSKELVKLARRMTFKEYSDYIIEKIFPWMDKNKAEISHAIDGYVTFIKYLKGKTTMNLYVYRCADCTILANVIYREGLYEVQIPENYSGPDPLAFESVKEIPDEILATPVSQNDELCRKLFEFSDESVVVTESYTAGDYFMSTIYSRVGENVITYKPLIGKLYINDRTANDSITALMSAVESSDELKAIFVL
jgi:hypothetical protein